MWIKIIVLSLVTVVLARNTQYEYTDEDARKDILTIINYAFGLKTNSHLGERNSRAQEKQGARNDDIGSLVTPTKLINSRTKSNQTNLHKYIERPIEGNVNQLLIRHETTTQRSNQPNDKETFHDVNERRIINVTEARGSEQHVNITQGQLSSRDSDNHTKTYNVNNKSRATKDVKEVKPTPSSQIFFDFTTTNEVNTRNSNFKTNQIDLWNVTLNKVHVKINRTEDVLQNVTTVKSKEIVTTVRPQTKLTTKKEEEDRWIWDDGTTSSTPTSTPAVDDRAAFAADKCPTGQVKFGDKCIEED